MKNISLFLPALFLCSCATLTTYQTAEVLDEGETQIGGAITNAYSLPEDESYIYDDASYAVPQIIFRKGLGKDKDIGIKISPMSMNLEYKKQFCDTNKVILSYGFGAGYFFLAASEHDQTHIADFYPTFLSTWNISKKISVTISPKIIIRYINSDAADEYYFSLLPGATITPGIRKEDTITT